MILNKVNNYIYVLSDKNHDLERSRLICTGDYETCFVHGKCRTKKWSFYSNPEDIDELINSLNRRGFRERKLKQVMIQERDVIITRLDSCPADTINQLVSNGAVSIFVFNCLK